MGYTQTELEARVQEGIRLAREGKRDAAYKIFFEITKVQPTNEQALIWRGAITTDPKETIHCLELVLSLSPDNARAKAGLEWARKKLKEEEAQTAPAIPAVEARREVTEEVPQESPVMPEPLPVQAITRQITAVEPKTVVSETKSQPAPYKSSRFETNKISSWVGPTFLSGTVAGKEKPARPNRLKRKTEKRSQPKEQSVVMSAALPKVALSVSERISRNGAGFFPAAQAKPTKTVNLGWPLLLFFGAIILAIGSFAAVQMTIVLGIAALALAMAGVMLFSRARI